MVNTMLTTNHGPFDSITNYHSAGTLTTECRPLVPASDLDTSLKFGSRSACSIQVTSPNAFVGGKSQAEWGDEWWKWINMGGDHPEQPGSVYFLKGTFGQGHVTVPDGAYIFTPVLNAALDNITIEDCNRSRLLTVREERAVLKSLLDAATDISFTISYRNTEISPIKNWINYRHVSPKPFSYTYDGSTHDGTVSDGYWVMLNPLPPGVYKIDIGGTFNFRDANNVGIIDINGDGNINGQTSIELDLQEQFDSGNPKPYELATSYTVTVVPKTSKQLSVANLDLSALV